MALRPYTPSAFFVALCSGFITVTLVFVALPYLALLTVGPSVEEPPFTVSVDIKNKVITTPEEGLARAASHILAFAYAGVGDMTRNAADAIMATKLYDALGEGVPQSFTVDPGMRLEEVADVLSDSLGWSKAQKQIFLNMARTAGDEGMLYPSTYVVHASTTPVEAYDVIKGRFDERVTARYTSEVAAAVPMEDALALASIVEREAGSVDEMRLIAGIFWNRIFISMRLQSDATLQYARGTAKNGWWPVPRARDKYLESPFNTYLHQGFPPGPIASPSIAAIQAALNPTQTECFFFFHAKGKFYCSKTYDEHVAKLKSIYGRGK